MTTAYLPAADAPTFPEELAAIGVRKVRVTATVTVEAYVLGEHEEQDDLTARISHEIWDAVKYRAPHLTDTEAGDGLIATTGDPDDVVVTVDQLDDLGPADAYDAAEMAEGHAGEVF